MAQFIKTIQNLAFQCDLWEKNSKILIGVSGGSDSICLLSVMVKLAAKYDLKLHVAHVNYGLRGDDSKNDEIFVTKLVAKYDLPLSVLTVRNAQQKGNLENNLRKIRYDYFEKLRNEINFDLVAVAHNQDDQAETVLMRILRGSGLNGLGAMKSKTEKIIRPLLQTSKRDILAYLKENKLKFRTDKSNANLDFTRNKIRHELLPYLEKNLNPNIKKTLTQWSSVVADDYAYISQGAKLFKSIDVKNGKICLSSAKFLKLSVAMQRQELRSIFSELKNGTHDIEVGQIEEVLKLMKSSKSKASKAVIGGLKILKKGDIIEIFC
jgi:tRNA(Ile)-lysidine synthase